MMLRRAMLAGAREFLVKPFSSDELSTSIRQVYARERGKAGRLVLPAPAAAPSTNGHSRTRQGQVVAFFSPKGGVGRTIRVYVGESRVTCKEAGGAEFDVFARDTGGAIAA